MSLTRNGCVLNWRGVPLSIIKYRYTGEVDEILPPAVVSAFFNKQTVSRQDEFARINSSDIMGCRGKSF